MGLPFLVAIGAALFEQSKSGPPDSGSRDESPDAAIARNRISEIMRDGGDVQTQSPKVPESAYKNPDGIDDLYQRVQAMSITDVVALHQRWESIRNRLEQGLQGFGPEISKAMEGKWEGAAAKAASDGIKEYVDKSSGLISSVQIVAEKVKIIRSGIEVTRPAVQEPPAHSWTSNVASWVPGPTWKLNQHRDDSAHDASVNVVKNVFYPAVREADTGVPLVPKPYNPVHNSGDRPSAPNNSRQPSSSGTDTGDEGTTVDSAQLAGTENSTVPSSANPVAERESTPDQTTTTPAGTNPSTQPASTNPGTDPSLTRPGTSSPGSPGTPSPGTPSPGVPGLGSPAPGRSINGLPSVPGGVPAAASARPGTGRPGTSGMPGMIAPGARGKGDDDKEHQTKDYLVNQRNGEELTGLGAENRVKSVPPVIGE
ncbi:hypothetical protein [Nocardia gamkensis]|uniref:PPE family domain-containing protein n=1 Tax=Nocardia gamkensis TaxID=352869 RepID=A0A7X6L2Y4_9NOCA|nr:hypothetical protein [Nocardia gamkensis]NKY26820.1 hypothetical protein [Nocardia gamkensis]NQE68259.1 hypothetical protein [Nocardia gamkensis]